MKKYLLLILIASLGAWLNLSFAMTGEERFNSERIEKSVSTGVRQSDEIHVTLGATSAEQQLDLSGVHVFNLDIILPIEGASFALYNPDGQWVLDSLSSDLQVQPGSSIEKGLPGARYALPTLTNASRGVWTVSYFFPPLLEDNSIVATWRGQSSYGAALVLYGNIVSTNDLIPLSVLVTKDQQNHADADVQIRVTLPDGRQQLFQAYDNGEGADLKKGDGIYTVTERFQPSMPGQYHFNAVASFSESGKTIQRTSSYQYEAQLATVFIHDIQIIDTAPSGQCLPEVIVRLLVTSTEAADYSFFTNADLVDPESHDNPPGAFPAFKHPHLPPGQHTVDITFDNQELISRYGHNSELNLRPIAVSRTGQVRGNLGLITSSPLVPVEQTFIVNETSRCREMVEIPRSLAVVENWSDDGSYIESLTFNVPAFVKIPGQYHANVSIYPEGDNLVLAFLPTIQSLQAGDNYLSFTVPGEKLSVSDGPYDMRGLIFYGQGESKHLSRVGVTKAYDKEIFIPKP